MRIGIPRERKAGECRVAITPSGVNRLVSAGNRVLIETDAGSKSGFSDQEFTAAGAEILAQLSEVWDGCDLLVKVKEPAPEEYQFFRSDLSLFCFLHPAAEKDLTLKMLDSGLLAFDYDLLMLDDGSLPILRPMSVIAGKLAVQIGARGLQSDNGGRGVLLGGCQGVAPAKVLVLGAGAAGGSAVEVAAGMGAEVVVIDLLEEKLKHLERVYQGAVGTVRGKLASKTELEQELTDVDLLIGAVLVPGALAPKLISREMIKQMPKGSVLVDICIDQGGCAESSRAQSLENPYYRESEVLHYAVPNMPALVPRTSTLALTAANFPWLENICSLGPEKAAAEIPELGRSLVCRGGKLCNKTVAESLDLVEFQAS